MGYTITLALVDYPAWRLDTVTATLDEHGVKWECWGVELMSVTGSDEQTTRMALHTAFQRVGGDYRDFEIDLLA